MKSKNSRKIIVHITSPWNYDHGISVCVDDPDFF